MAGDARGRHLAEFMRSMYPAFSRRATQVCVLSSALEKIALGATDVQGIALAALAQANPFGWSERAPGTPADTRPEQEKKHLSAGEGGKENHG